MPTTDARSYVAGYTVGQDRSERILQMAAAADYHARSDVVAVVRTPFNSWADGAETLNQRASFPRPD